MSPVHWSVKSAKSVIRYFHYAHFSRAYAFLILQFRVLISVGNQDRKSLTSLTSLTGECFKSRGNVVKAPLPPGPARKVRAKEVCDAF
jgi:hypothetical protein